MPKVKEQVKEIEIPHREWLEFLDEQPANVRGPKGTFDIEAINNYDLWVEALTQKVREYWVGKKVRFLQEERTIPWFVENGFSEEVVLKEGEIYEITDLKLFHFTDKKTNIKYLRTSFRIDKEDDYFNGMRNFIEDHLFEFVD